MADDDDLAKNLLGRIQADTRAKLQADGFEESVIEGVNAAIATVPVSGVDLIEALYRQAMLNNAVVQVLKLLANGSTIDAETTQLLTNRQNDCLNTAVRIIGSFPEVASDAAKMALSPKSGKTR